ALVAADSVGDSTVDAFAYRNWGYVDITVDANRALFPPSVADSIATDDAVMKLTDGVQAALEVVGSASNRSTRQGTSGVTILGLDAHGVAPFGFFELTDGRRTNIDGLPARSVIVSRTLADKIDARAGDELTITAEGVAARSVPGGPGVGRPLRVGGIARAEGPGAYTLGSVVFLRLEDLQETLGIDAYQINVVRISAPGGIRDADDAGAAAMPVIEAAVHRISSPEALTVRHAKKREADLATESTTFIRAMLIGMSAIVVAAGAALMVNITGMLAEERRTRLGVLRALGLKRRGVVGLSIVEGAMYALAAGIAGVVAGVAAGRLVAARFGSAFAEFAGEDFDFEFFFTLKPATVLTAFAIGSLLTLAVIALASRRTARMTITAAIRNLPEPQSERARRVWPRRIRLAAGTVGGVGGLASGAPFLQLVGAILLILVVSSLVRRRMSARLHASLTGLAIAMPPFVVISGMSPETDAGEFFGVFVVALVTSVFGLTILATANLHVAETVVGLLGRAFAGLRAILRPPLAYLSRRPTRTGLTTGVFALIIAMLTMFAVFLVIFKPSYQDFGNGWDVRVLSTGSPRVELPAEIRDDVRRTLLIPTRGYVGPIKAEDGFNNAERTFVPLFLIPDGAGASPPLKLEQRDKRYRSDAAAWQAALRDPALVISNFGAPGQTVQLRAADGTTVSLKIAGVQPFGLLDGVFGNAAMMRRFESSPAGATVMVDVVDPARARAVARAIESSLFAVGVDADAVQELLDQADRANRAFFSTIDILMRMGLIVGILSLGIVAARIVTERRHVIGVLRALGYRRRQVLAGLMTEATVTATIGVIVGSTVGVIMGWIFYRQGNSEGDFGIDWAQFGGVMAIVYVAVLLVTFGPAWRASRLPPAEAVRYSE
ncbi:MAG: ABC transporter permease, partial [Actinomycetota bacterium]